MRTYRALTGANVTLSTPPLPASTTAAGCQVLPLAETSMRYRDPYAVSQRRMTRRRVRAEPRSTVIDWLSVHQLLHRVVGSPSTAALAV
jgi:hypothetical protein